MKSFLFIIISFLSFFYHGFAQSSPHEALAQDIFSSVRCPSCEGQTLSESNADIAKDLKKSIRKKIQTGQSKKEILYNLQINFGDDILQMPPIKKETYLLWFGPYLLMSMTIIFILLTIQKGRKNE